MSELGTKTLLDLKKCPKTDINKSASVSRNSYNSQKLSRIYKGPTGNPRRTQTISPKQNYMRIGAQHCWRKKNMWKKPWKHTPKPSERIKEMLHIHTSSTESMLEGIKKIASCATLTALLAILAIPGGLPAAHIAACWSCKYQLASTWNPTENIATHKHHKVTNRKAIRPTIQARSGFFTFSWNGW